MRSIFINNLAAMTPEDVKFIISQLPQKEASPIPNGFAETTCEDTDDESRRRRHIDREWPEVGTVLTADYYGEQYRAEIIPATKRLKSGRQIRIESGPSKGALCNSLSEAMLQATETQRATHNLGRKGVSNGWVFWQWDGKPVNIAGEDDEEETA